MLEPARPLLLVGGGKMGGAAGGWLRAGARPTRCSWSSPTPRGGSLPSHGVARSPRPTTCRVDCAPSVLLAVKPQIMADALPAFAGWVGAGHAGPVDRRRQDDRRFERLLGAGPRHRPGMPNTPAAVGRGVTVLCANARATEASGICPSADGGDRRSAWVEDEELMDAVTAARAAVRPMSFS